MEKPERDAAGDYGYDLVHEDVPAGRRPDTEARREPVAHAEQARADLESDLGYDEAHGF
jgi:hypothetical protein